MIIRLSHLAILAGLLASAVADAVPRLAGNSYTFYGGGYPRATFLSDGSVLGTTTQGSNGTNILTIIKSTNKGASWSHFGEITRSVGDITNTYLLQLKSGRVLAAYREHTTDSAGVKIYHITVSYSDDLGASWSYLSNPEVITGGDLGIWEPFMRLSTTGDLQLYYSREQIAKNNQDSILHTSTDGGKTWSNGSVISGANLTTRDGMLGVVNTGGKNLLAVFESYASGPGGNNLATIVSVSSPDDGATWNNRSLVYAPAKAGTNAGAPQIAAVGSALVVSFMTDEDKGGQTPWTSYAATKIVTSDDGGKTWGDKLTVGPVGSSWPGLLTLNSTSLLVLYGHDGSKVQTVTLSSST